MNLIQRTEYFFSRRIVKGIDVMTDKRICGQSLAEYVPSLYRDDKNGIGGTGSQSTHYALLKKIFSHVALSSDDAVLDVGCGKGRVLAFLVKERCPCRLYGIEHNEEVGRLAAGWAARYDQIQIMVGDALSLDYEPYTVLTLARSFLPKTFLTFTERLEAQLSHPVTVVYWYDQQSGYLLRDRPGWELQYSEKILRINGLRLFRSPQSYSVWKYDPGRLSR